jgi:hypothetical protein
MYIPVQRRTQENSSRQRKVHAPASHWTWDMIWIRVAATFSKRGNPPVSLWMSSTRIFVLSTELTRRTRVPPTIKAKMSDESANSLTTRLWCTLYQTKFNEFLVVLEGCELDIWKKLRIRPTYVLLQVSPMVKHPTTNEQGILTWVDRAVDCISPTWREAE